MSDNLTAIWSKCLDYIKEEINDSIVFDNFYEESKLVQIDNKMYIIVDSILSKHHLDSDINLIEHALLQVTETDFKANIITEIDYNNKLSVKNVVVEEVNNNILNDNLNCEFVFDNFVVGPSNKESYQAAIAVSNKPGKLFNPLFIYGNSGLGKTHLIHSIGNHIKQQKPNMRLLYVTSEEFFNDYIDVVRNVNNKTNEWFDSKYRDVDVLIMDDIQFLKNKEKSNEKFFHVYNDLFIQNKQIIITSDVMPRQLDGLEQRLVSRFAQGLTVGINRPEYNTSIEILKRKLKYFGEDDNNLINDQALEYIATNFSHDVRDLEGALRRLIFYTINMHNTNNITMDIIYEAFADFQSITIQGNISEQKILKTVCNYYNLTKAQLTGNSRQRIVSNPRQIAIYLTRTLLETSYEKIGKIYGSRDHSTIMSSYHKVNDKIKKNDPSYILVIKELTALLKT